MSSPREVVRVDLRTRHWRKIRRERFLTIVRLFWSYVLEYWIEWWERRLIGGNALEQRVRDRRRRQAIRFRETAVRMGGLLIKQGQFMSSRVDLLPPEFIQELTKLQDEVPGVPLPAVREVLEREFARPVEQIYQVFDPIALAAASLGQVHRATLFTGEDVAVKVQRPGIEQIVEIDLDSTRWVIKQLKRWTNLGRDIDLDGIAREFTDTLRAELDYVAEADNADEFRTAYAGNRSVYVPAIYREFTTRHVLTLEYVEGLKITNYAALEAAGISRMEVANRLLNIYFHQIFELGFFHADPHPGNLFIQPGPVIVFVDFGLMGRVTPDVKRETRRLLAAMVNRDPGEIVNSLVALGFLQPQADLVAVRDAFGWLINRYYKSTLAELAETDPREIIQQVGSIIYQQAFQIPANYIFLGRAVGTLAGLSTGLAPELNVMRVAEPYVRNLAGQGSDVDWTTLVVNQAKDYARMALDIPRLAERTLIKAERGELEIRIQPAELARTMQQLERTGRRMVNTILATGLVLAGTLFQTSGHDTRGWICFVLALLLIMSAFIGSRLRPS